MKTTGPQNKIQPSLKEEKQNAETHHCKTRHFQQPIKKDQKCQEAWTYDSEPKKNGSTDTDAEMTRMVELADNDVKTAIINDNHEFKIKHEHKNRINGKCKEIKWNLQT